MDNPTLQRLEAEFVQLSRERILSIPQAKVNSARKAEVRAKLIEAGCWTAKRIDKLLLAVK